eukprot:gene6915-30896_t
MRRLCHRGTHNATRRLGQPQSVTRCLGQPQCDALPRGNPNATRSCLGQTPLRRATPLAIGHPIATRFPQGKPQCDVATRCRRNPMLRLPGNPMRRLALRATPMFRSAWVQPQCDVRRRLPRGNPNCDALPLGATLCYAQPAWQPKMRHAARLGQPQWPTRCRRGQPQCGALPWGNPNATCDALPRGNPNRTTRWPWGKDPNATCKTGCLRQPPAEPRCLGATPKRRATRCLRQPNAYACSGQPQCDALPRGNPNSRRATLCLSVNPMRRRFLWAPQCDSLPREPQCDSAAVGATQCDA